MKRPKFSQIAPVVAVLQTLVLIIIALITLIGSLVTGEFEARVLLPELLLYLVFIAGLWLVATGLRQRRAWARAPMIAVQLIVIGISYEDFWQSDPLLWKVVAVLLVAVSVAAIASSLKLEIEPK